MDLFHSVLSALSCCFPPLHVFIFLRNCYCRAGSEATNRAAMSFLYVYNMYAVTLGSARAYGGKYEL